MNTFNLFLVSILLCIHLLHVPVIAQETENKLRPRTFKTGVLSEVASFTTEGFDLYRPEVFNVSMKWNKLYVYDYYQHNLYSLDIKDGEITNLKTLGGGRGSGPKEFRNPTDLCISESELQDYLVLIDYELGKVSVWDAKSGNFIRSFNPYKFIPFRIACNEGEIILYNASESKEGHYVAYTVDGDFVKDFKSNRSKLNTFLDGGYIASDENAVYFGSTGRSQLTKLPTGSDEPKIINSFVASVVNNTTIVTRKGSTSFEKRAKDFKSQTRGIGHFNKYVLVFYSGRTDAYCEVVDFYSKNDLTYQFSVELSFRGQYAKFNNGYITILGHDKETKEKVFKVYKIESGI